MHMYYHDYFCWTVNKVYLAFASGARIPGVSTNVFKNIINISLYFTEIQKDLYDLYTVFDLETLFKITVNLLSKKHSI